MKMATLHYVDNARVFTAAGASGILPWRRKTQYARTEGAARIEGWQGAAPAAAA